MLKLPLLLVSSWIVKIKLSLKIKLYFCYLTFLLLFSLYDSVKFIKLAKLFSIQLYKVSFNIVF